MKIIPLLCVLASSWAHQGEISPEPNVVLQSVYFAKPKPEVETVSRSEDAPSCTAFNDISTVVKRIMTDLYPPTTRYKREDSNYSPVEGFDDKTMGRLLEALEELKEDSEKDPEGEKEVEEEGKKTILDHNCRRSGKWHNKIVECHAKRRKGDVENYRKMLRENLEDFLTENQDLDKRLRTNYRKKDDMERRRLKDRLGESWPGLSSEDKLAEDLLSPLAYHHSDHHRERGYHPSGGYRR